DPSYSELGARELLLTRGLIEWFEKHLELTPEQKTHWRASPAHAARFDGLCSARVITAGFDPLRDEGEAYAAKLARAGVHVDHSCFVTMPHGFVAFGAVLEE